jgi:hypothetical protein
VCVCVCVCADFCGCSVDFMYLFYVCFFHVCYSVFCFVMCFKCATIMHLYGVFFALYKFNNQSINQTRD